MFFLSSHGVFGTAVNHPHNHLMNIAFHGGITALVFFLIVIFLVASEIDKIEDGKLYTIAFAGMIAAFTAALVDTLDYSMFYFLIILPFLLNKREKEKKSKKMKCFAFFAFLNDKILSGD